MHQGKLLWGAVLNNILIWLQLSVAQYTSIVSHSDSGRPHLQSQGFQYGLGESHFFGAGLEIYDLIRSRRWIADTFLLWPIYNIINVIKPLIGMEELETAVS